MEAGGGPLQSLAPLPEYKGDDEKIIKRLLDRGVAIVTPKMLRAIKKRKESMFLRKRRRMLVASGIPPLSNTQKQIILEEFRLYKVRSEYKEFSKEMKSGNFAQVGRPWDGQEKARLREIAMVRDDELSGSSFRLEHLHHLRDVLGRRMGDLRWLLDDDFKINPEWVDGNNLLPPPLGKTRLTSEGSIQFLVDRLSDLDICTLDWRFSYVIERSGLKFSQKELLKIVKGLGDIEKWKQAFLVVKWAYDSNRPKRPGNSVIYNLLLSLLRKFKRPFEALHIFDLMREDLKTYPTLSAYHTVAFTLAEAGLLNELMSVIKCMDEKPMQIHNVHDISWDPTLAPDIIIFNTVLIACRLRKRWKGVFWVFNSLEGRRLTPSGTTYALAMEVMLVCGKYDLVHKYFEEMLRSGKPTSPIHYRVLVKSLSKEGKIDEAVKVVGEAERESCLDFGLRYELACGLCHNGRWQEAIALVDMPEDKPEGELMNFSGLIKSALDGGHALDSVAIFEHLNKGLDHFPDISTVDVMLKVYGKAKMFSHAKKLFEGLKTGEVNLIPGVKTYSSMLWACAETCEWDYLEFVFKEMTLSGFKLYQLNNTPIMVRASRSGKHHLLERMFEEMVEEGEVPDFQLFGEMVGEAVARGDMRRAVSLVKAMCYAPYKVSVGEWRRFLDENHGRIDHKNCQDFLHALVQVSVDAPRDSTLENLVLSLRSLCVHNMN